MISQYLLTLPEYYFTNIRKACIYWSLARLVYAVLLALLYVLQL